MVTHEEKRKQVVEDIVQTLLTKCRELDPEGTETEIAQAALDFCKTLNAEEWGTLGRLAGHYKIKDSVPHIRTRFAVRQRLESIINS